MDFMRQLVKYLTPAFYNFPYKDTIRLISLLLYTPYTIKFGVTYLYQIVYDLVVRIISSS